MGNWRILVRVRLPSAPLLPKAFISGLGLYKRGRVLEAMGRARRDASADSPLALHATGQKLLLLGLARKRLCA